MEQSLTDPNALPAARASSARRSRALYIWGKLPQLTPLILALRNMRARLWRTLLTCLGIILGVAVILAISITNDSTLKSIRNVFDEASGRASLIVEASSPSSEGIRESVAARVRSFDGVVVAAPSVRATTLLAAESENWQIVFTMNGQAAGNTLQVLGVDPAIDRDARDYEIIAGRWLKDGAYEAIVTDEYAAEKELELGDDLIIILPGGGVERLPIVGLIKRDGAGLLNDGDIAFVSITVVQDLFERGGSIDDVSIVTTPEIANNTNELTKLKEGLAERLGEEYTVSYPASRGQLVTQMLSTYQQGLQFFSVVALFVGAFLIYNAFSMTVLERTREIGMLRALGSTRAQIASMVLTEAAALAVIGSALGVAFGVVLARGLIWMLGAVVSTSVDIIEVPLSGLITAVGIGTAVTVGSALMPALQAARTSPLEALRVQARPASRLRHISWISGLVLMAAAWISIYRINWPPEISFNIGSLSILILLFGATLTVPLVVGAADRIARPVAIAIFGNEGMLGAGNVSRSTGRTSLTVASLMIGLAMVIANNSLATAFITDITAWVETAIGGDLYVRAPLPMRENFERQLLGVPGVGGVTKIRYFSVKVAKSEIPPNVAEQDTVIFAAIDPDTYRAVGEFEFATNQGDADANWARFRRGDALFISNVVADRYNLEQGDTLRLVTRRGEHDFYVAALAVDFTGQGMIVSGSWNDMQRWFGEHNVDRYTISLAPGYTTEEVAAEIESRYQDTRSISVETTDEFKKQILDLSEQSFRLFDVLGLIGVVVAALGVINTLMMNVLERQREIGALRSLGLTRWQTTKMVLAEAATLGAIGGVFGLAFGYVMSKIFVLALNTISGYDLEYIFAPEAFAVSVFIALGVSQFAALYPAWKAAGVNIVEAIKHE
ncbi:MAG: FtsX-like permease family protein [Chloroflexi bacterium]|nr:FtsX-like permease family protein [Chloroflexota bacterium]